MIEVGQRHGFSRLGRLACVKTRFDSGEPRRCWKDSNDKKFFGYHCKCLGGDMKQYGQNLPKLSILQPPSDKTDQVDAFFRRERTSSKARVLIESSIGSVREVSPTGDYNRVRAFSFIRLRANLFEHVPLNPTVVDLRCAGARRQCFLGPKSECILSPFLSFFTLLLSLCLGPLSSHFPRLQSTILPPRKHTH